MFYVYIIKSKTSGKTYTGYTNNLEKRLLRHNKILPTKNTSFTAKQGKSWEVIYKEEFNTRAESMKREKELKSGKGREFLKNII